jgi:hypothetical protein
MTFRELHPFLLPDGRRFKTLVCAAHSMIASGQSYVTEERRTGPHTWSLQKISYMAARMAYDKARREAIQEDGE